MREQAMPRSGEEFVLHTENKEPVDVIKNQSDVAHILVCEISGVYTETVASV